MATAELNKKILESPHRELLNDLTFDIYFLNETVKLRGLSKIYDFVTKENSSWRNSNVKLPILEYHVHFYREFQAGLSNFITYIDQDKGENYLQNYWRNYVSDNHNITRYNKNILQYLSPETTFLFKVYNDYNQSSNILQGAFEMITDTFPREKGHMLGYEFITTESVISERRKNEQRHLTKLRNDYEQELASAQTNLTNHIKEANNKTYEFAQAITDLKTEKETSFDEWFQTSKDGYLKFQDTERINLTNWIAEKQKGYDELITSSTEKIDELEKLYQEKLSLEAPIIYWERRAIEMNKRGNKSLIGLMALIGLSAIILASFFFNAPMDVLQKLLAGEAYGIKWMLTSITIISFLAYGMRSLNKLMFSSYHLARDAEERRKLTYVYPMFTATADTLNVSFKDQHTGLVVYNTGEDSYFCQGMYVWDSKVWQRLSEKCDQTRVVIISKNIRLIVGDNTTASATVYPASTIDKTVSWSSSDPTIATVHPTSGLVTAQGVSGTATITATANTGGYIDIATVEVAIMGIQLDRTAVSIELGKPLTLHATVTPAWAPDKTVIWSSSNTNVAEVVGGAITTKATGTATITATTNLGAKIIQATITITNPSVPIVPKEAFAQGNLVVDGAGLLAIGRPSDVGLMFKFGSVVGASGSDIDANTTFEATDILYNPSDVAITHEWKSVPYEKGYYGMTGVSHTRSNIVDKGIGDPCRLVGLALTVSM